MQTFPTVYCQIEIKTGENMSRKKYETNQKKKGSMGNKIYNIKTLGMFDTFFNDLIGPNIILKKKKHTYK